MENKDNEAFVEEIANEALLEEISEKPRKGNGWVVVSFILLVAAILLGAQAFYYADRMSYYADRMRYLERQNEADKHYKQLYDLEKIINEVNSSKILNLKSEKSDLETEKSDLESEKSGLESEISRLKSKISQLETQQPSIYITKYAKQTIYYWDGSFKATNYCYSEEGSTLIIYTQKDGYGLTDDGWVPMDRLEKRFQE